jgi:general secretion pathway protein I
MNRHRRQSGFTLVEMLVALAIVGLSTGVLFKVISDNLDRAHHAQDDAAAAAIAQSLLAQSQSGPPPQPSAGHAGAFTWKLDVQPYAGAEYRLSWPVDAVTVRATVSWRDGGAVQSRSLTTLRVIPKGDQP